jgi:hypothetical protein
VLFNQPDPRLSVHLLGIFMMPLRWLCDRALFWVRKAGWRLASGRSEKKEQSE